MKSTMSRRPAIGHSLNLLIAIVASVLSGFVIYANKLLPTTLINKLEFDAIKQQLSYSYFATYQHMGPYCLGILTGYLLHKRPHVNLPKHLTWMLWLLLPPLSFTTLLLTYLWNGAYDDPAMINPSPIVSAFYVAIHRTIWTALVAWLVFATTTGRAKTLAQLLSHSLFIPLSRLSYSIYLVHLPIIMFRALNLRHTVEWSDQNILWEACGNFVASVIMGYFLNITFESPIINLENYISGKNRHPRVGGGVDAYKSAPSGADTKTNSYLDADPGSTGDTSSSHETDGTGFLERERKSSSSSVSMNSSSSLTEADSNKTEPASSDSNLKKPLKPKQTSVEGIFGHQDEQPDASRSHLGVKDTTSSSQDQRPNSDTKTAEILADKSQGDHEKATEKAKTTEMLRKHDRLDLARARAGSNMSLMRRRNNDDLYNITSEYLHYAPAGYHQWRLYNQSGNSQGSRLSTARLRQYNTLARSDRIGRDELMFDPQHRHRAPMGYRDQPQHWSDNSPDTGHTAYKQYDDSATEQVYFSQDHHQGGAYPPNSYLEREDPLQNHMISRRLQTRYNTLTGANTRDLRSRYPNQVLGNWDGGRYATRLDAQQVESPVLGWLQKGALIPRIDSSTLRRQPRRAVDSAANSSILEENPDHGVEETSVL